MSSAITGLPAAELADLAPLVRRAVGLDAACLVRLRHRDERVAALVRLPFGVLAARTIPTAGGPAVPADVCVRGAELLAWLDGERPDPPAARDADWRGGVPPAAGWRRLETVPDAEVRPLVRAGALALKQAAEREGLPPGAQPRREVADALLDAVVLTVSGAPGRAEVSLRTLSALTRLGFLARGSHLAVDVSGRWQRLAASYGSVYAERPGAGLGLL